MTLWSKKGQDKFAPRLMLLMEKMLPKVRAHLMLIKRVLSSIFLIIITALAVSFDLFCGIVVTALVGIGLYEFFRMVENKGIFIYRNFAILIGIILSLSVAFRFELTKQWELLFLCSILIILIILQFRCPDSSKAISGISTTLFGIFYIAWLFTFIIKVRYLPRDPLFSSTLLLWTNSKDVFLAGTKLVTFLILVTKLGDIGSYLIGTRFGKSALIPRISEKKTIEGSIGGLLFSILMALALRPILNFSYLHLGFLGLFLGVMGQFGDLSESLIKRDCRMKDSGNIFPGLGGVLDIIDSLIFTSPVFYFYLSAILR